MSIINFNADSVTRAIMAATVAKGHRALSSTYFTSNINLFINTINHVGKAYGNREHFIVINGVPYSLESYTIPARITQIIERTNVYFTRNAEYRVPPVFTIDWSPLEEVAPMTPGEFNDFVTFVNDGLRKQLKLTSLDLDKIHTLDSIGCVRKGERTYQVSDTIDGESPILAGAYEYVMNVDVTEFLVEDLSTENEEGVLSRLIGKDAPTQGGGTDLGIKES